MRRRASVFLLALSGALLFAIEADAAGLNLCNQTSYVLYAATASLRVGGTLVQGWARIAPGSCAIALDKSLDPQTAYFLYARTSQAHAGPPRDWGGATQFCVKDGNFTLKAPAGFGGCQNDDGFTVPFAALAIGNNRSWTATFAESKKLATPEAARNAGLTRLLSDAGYRLGSGKGNITAVEALKRFHARMRLPANAAAPDLFDALETEALKVTAPAGYSICNDTEQPLYAAIGMKTGKVWTARGWWNVAPGACARALTTPIARQKIYLLVERRGKNNHAVVLGQAKFCVTDIAFDIEGREHCDARGLREAGFAETNVKGLPGYAAHVGEEGLLPAAPVVE